MQQHLEHVRLFTASSNYVHLAGSFMASFQKRLSAARYATIILSWISTITALQNYSPRQDLRINFCFFGAFVIRHKKCTLSHSFLHFAPLDDVCTAAYSTGHAAFPSLLTSCCLHKTMLSTIFSPRWPFFTKAAVVFCSQSAEPAFIACCFSAACITLARPVAYSLAGVLPLKELSL